MARIMTATRRGRWASMVAALALAFAGLSVVAAAPTLAAGTVYYVSSSLGADSNNGTSPSTPWQTLAKVNSMTFNPGDQIRFQRGDTWTGTLDITSSGTSSSVIALWFYGSSTSHRPLITGGGLIGDCINLVGSYVQVDNLEGNNCGYAGAVLAGSHETVKHSQFDNNAAGIQTASGSNGDQIYSNTLTNNNILNVNNPSGSSGAFGVLLNGNYANVSHNKITGSSAVSQAYGYDGSAVEIYNGSNNTVHHNYGASNNAFSELGGTSCSGNKLIYNRESSSTADSVATGIVLPGSCTGTVIQHNSIYLVGASTQALVCYSTCASSTAVQDNVLRGEQQALWMDGSGWTLTGNVVNGPSNQAISGTNTTADAALVNPPSDLHLTASSPAVDRGSTLPYSTDLDGNPVPSGPAPDSGAYEYQQPTTG